MWRASRLQRLCGAAEFAAAAVVTADVVGALQMCLQGDQVAVLPLGVGVVAEQAGQGRGGAELLESKRAPPELRGA